MALALKEQGNACFRAGDHAGALARFQEALTALDACRDAAGELSVAQEADAVVCHANAAACALKLGRAGDAVASATAGLALPSAATLPQLQAKLYARLSAALEAAGEVDTPRARDARTRPARLGLPPLERSAAAEAASAAARNRIAQMLMGMLRGQLVTKAALKTQVLAAFGDTQHVDARDNNGMGVLWGATGGMIDMNPQPHAPTGWLLRELLALGADPSSRFADSGDSRTPLMYCAHQGDTPAALEAADILLQAGARVNARSGDDWTALMTSVATDDREPGWHCGKMVRLLLKHGANVNQCCTGDTPGQTALLLACAHGALRCDAIPDLVARASKATLLQRNMLGHSPLFLAAVMHIDKYGKRKDGHSPTTPPSDGGKAFSQMRAGMLAAGLAAEVAQEELALALIPLVHKLIEAHNQVVAMRLPEGKYGALRERYALRALLRAAGLPETRTAACEADANPYLTLHAWLEACTPAVVRKAHTAHPKTGSPEGGLLRLLSTEVSVLLAGMPTAPVVRAGSQLTPARHGKLLWEGIWSFHLLIYEPVRHSFAFAVPNDAALDALASLSPLLEVGAGTGYWAALLRRRGADVVATDVAPPDGTSGTLDNPHHVSVVAGGRVLCADGEAAAAALGADRAIVFMYPHSADAAALHGGAAGPWDVRALRAYDGPIVCHVGHLALRQSEEERAAQALTEDALPVDIEAGDTTSAAFQELLRERFTLVRTVPLPRWPLDADSLTIWLRKPATELPPRAGVCAAPGPACACELCAAAARSACMQCALPSCGERAGLKSCVACMGAAYCSGEHQRADRERHKLLCNLCKQAAEERKQASDGSRP